jgi:hypothetical protein
LITLFLVAKEDDGLTFLGVTFEVLNPETNLGNCFLVISLSPGVCLPLLAIAAAFAALLLFVVALELFLF